MKNTTTLFAKVFILSILAFFISVNSSQAEGSSSSEGFNITEMINHHIMDAHEWHIATLKNDDGSEKHISIPLPVILYTDKGVDFFSSANFHNEKHFYQSSLNGYVMEHEHIYYADANGVKVEGNAPIDISITKNVASMMISAFLLLFVFSSVASGYKTRPNQAPKGIQSFFEPIILFIKEEVVIPNIGEKKHQKYLPYILTVFFFIWFNNLLGLLPSGANTSGNIAFTLTLSAFTLLLTVFSANGHYWKHIFAMPGVPLPMLIILTPVEIIGIFTKPFALMIRLFANITAGHTIILSLIGLIFMAGHWAAGLPVTVFVLAMMCLELFVAVLQAYIFSLLTALFIGQAIADDEHHDDHH